MKRFIIKTGRIFYGVAIAGIGLQQFLYGDFRPVILPAWPSCLPLQAFWAWMAGAALIGCGAAIILQKRTRSIALILGGVFLVPGCFCQVPWHIIADPYAKHLALWTDPLKELALSGGAFVIAGSFSEQKLSSNRDYFLLRLLEKLIPAGSIFFSVTMICFGIDHFLYTKGVSELVPSWIADHIFWTYFVAVALIGSGVAIILQIRLKAIGILLGSMLFLWFVFLHIPRAITDPFTDKGNEVSSVFEALGFSGIAFVISCSRTPPLPDTLD